MTLDTQRIRADFPILSETVHGHPVTFLDSAASSQKPLAVLQAMDDVYRHRYANVHRGVYLFSDEATQCYDAARAKIAAFFGARETEEIVFTRNATESLNLLAYSYARALLQPGDEIVLTELEHHANFVPWLEAARTHGLVLKFAPLTKDGRIDEVQFASLLGPRTRLVSFAHVSNVLGTITDPRPLIERAHAVGAKVILDGCQSAPHMPVDVQALGCDFSVCSGHKMLGPTGIGVLYGRRELLEAMPPFMTGGDMISHVGFDGARWADIPLKFEAGTPAFVEAIGLGAAIDYLQALGMHNVRAHERALTAYALERLSTVRGLRLLGPLDPDVHGGVASFTLERIHPHDLASLLDEQGIAVRAGHHCAQPLHARLGITATARASFYVYTLPEEIDRLIDGIEYAQRVLKR